MGQRSNSIDVHVSKRLRAARIAADLSQEQAGAVLGCTFQQVQKYEDGAKNRISAGNLALLAKLYRRPIAWFYEGIAEIAPTEGDDGDLGTDILATVAGKRLAQAFLAIESNVDRMALCVVVEAIAFNSAQLQAAE